MKKKLIYIIFAVSLSQLIASNSLASVTKAMDTPQYHCIKNIVRHAGVRIKGYTYPTLNQHTKVFYSGLNAKFTSDSQPYITSYSTACFDIKALFEKRQAAISGPGIDIHGFKIDVKKARDCKLWVLFQSDLHIDDEIEFNFLDGYVQFYKVKGPAGIRYCKTEELLSPEEHTVGNFI